MTGSSFPRPVRPLPTPAVAPVTEATLRRSASVTASAPCRLSVIRRFVAAGREGEVGNLTAIASSSRRQVTFPALGAIERRGLPTVSPDVGHPALIAGHRH